MLDAKIWLVMVTVALEEVSLVVSGIVSILAVRARVFLSGQFLAR